MPLYKIEFIGHYLTGYAVIDRPSKRQAYADFRKFLRQHEPELARKADKHGGFDIDRIDPKKNPVILFNGDY